MRCFVIKAIKTLGLMILLFSSVRAEAAAGFSDVTEESGLGGLTGGKASWCDFDNDGFVDLYAEGILWRNIDGERFVRVEGLPDEMRGAGIWGDFDNDGYADIYCYETNRLFRNVEGRAFVDVSYKLPPGARTSSRAAAWGDFNGNGFLDLYIGGYENWEAGITYPDLLLFNDGGKSFSLGWSETRIMDVLGLRAYRARGVAACDFNRDGDMDIYVSNYRLQPNLLWLNQGGGNFRDVAEEYGVAGDNISGAWGHTIGSAWGDFDNDGYFDLFVGNFSHPPEYQDRPKFLKNLGTEKDFIFKDKSGSAGLHWQESYASPALGDYDNDGLLDIFLTTVYPGDRSVLYRNTGDWKFSDVTDTSGIDSLRTYQAAWADYNNNGYLDIVTGGRLYRNEGSGNNWLKIYLEGGGPVNRSAVGASVFVRSGKDLMARQVEGGTGEGNQNSPVLHFGLGKKRGPVSLKVVWTDGTVNNLVAWRVNRNVRVRYR